MTTLKSLNAFTIAALAFSVSTAVPAIAKNGASATQSRYEDLAVAPYSKGYLSKADSARLQDELLFQSAVQTYLWALPALNMYGMK
ncbi:hypothetical protein NZA98_10415, partial [Escherichia coli]|nr:hypothetical protein [Escherichia coli]